MKPYDRAPKTLSVLVVEDEFLIAMELVEQLEDAGYEVIGPVATVAAALVALDQRSPHACILDVNLRGEHSAAVAVALKARNVPFMLSSAYEQATLQQHPAFNGVTNIGKPAPPEKLLTALGSILKN